MANDTDVVRVVICHRKGAFGVPESEAPHLLEQAGARSDWLGVERERS